MNHFQPDLQYSHEQQNAPIWESLYKKAFPTMKAMTNHAEDGDHQRVGIDRTIVLESGAAIWIDEKVRRGDWDDILLEYISNDRTQSPGWVEKHLVCHYISYLMEPTEKLYILPVIQMQAAWLKNKKSWIAKYPKIEAQNNGWNTISCAVPIRVLYPEIGKMYRPQQDILIDMFDDLDPDN